MYLNVDFFSRLGMMTSLMARSVPLVSVLGAGIVGCSVAWELAKRGLRVILVDSHDEALSGASKAGFGSLTPFSDPFFTAEGQAVRHAADGVTLYRTTWLSEIKERSRHAISFQDKGLIKLCPDQESFTDAKHHAALLKAAGYRADILTVDNARALEPALTDNFAGAILFDEPWVDKDEYFTALRLILSDHPLVQWRPNTVISQITSSPAHLTFISRDGTSFSADYGVVCTGLTTFAVDGVPHFPLKWIRGDAISIHTSTDVPLLQRHVYMANGFITPRHNGCMLLGATYDDERGIPPASSRLFRDRIEVNQLLRLLDANIALVPAISSCHIARVWRDWRAGTPDDIPILGPISSEPRIIIATGFIGLGITMAPSTAVVVAEHIERAGTFDFPSDFRPDRFW